MTWRENYRKSMETLGAFWRQGLRELGAALYGPGTAAQHPEYGMIGTKTPGEVQEGRRIELNLNEEPKRSLKERVKQMDAGRDAGHEQRERDAREMTME